MNTEITLIKKIYMPKKKILFLGYNRKETSLIDELLKANCEIWYTCNPIKKIEGFDLIISFGYRHLIKKHILKICKIPIINLHISFLPWNRGSHPNFWSFYDKTPSGVTIHLIDEGVDTGEIIYQKKVHFKAKENTFKKSHTRLIFEVEKLFIKNIENIIMGNYKVKHQKSNGTYHKSSDLPKNFSGWDANIKEEIAKLYKSGVE